MFYEEVAEMVNGYLASGVDPKLYEFLQDDFNGLLARHGGVVGTTFQEFSVVSAALHGSGGHAVNGRAGPGGTAQAAYATDRLHRRRSAHAAFHVERRAPSHPQGSAIARRKAPAYCSRLASTSRGPQ
jgi:hypothetical protein